MFSVVLTFEFINHIFVSLSTHSLMADAEVVSIVQEIINAFPALQVSAFLGLLSSEDFFGIVKKGKFAHK